MEQIDKEALYPLLFEPMYKEVLWGGRKLAAMFGRNIPDDVGPIGEAWEICDRPGIESLVANGSLAGVSIHTLVQLFGRDFVGSKFSGIRFPIMVKLIDAAKRLSLQVHPGEETCNILNGAAEPKTEMWYILDAEPGAKIYAGLRANATRQQFMNAYSSQNVESLLQCFDSVPGDAYFINAGRIHTIGAGNVILEIQQNSDTSFRIYDWNRVDRNNNPRPLQIEQGLASIDFTDRTVPRISGPSDITDNNRKYPLINHCPEFRVDELKLVDEWRDDTMQLRSFHIITPINNTISIRNELFLTEVSPGASALIPACFGSYLIDVPRGVTTSVLRTTL